jgi:hypothetical protein
MLVTLGARRNEADGDVVDLLLACHDRIRAFTALAVKLAVTVDLAAAEVREGAGAVRRYFAEALPLHVADEEDDLVLLLAGRAAEVDAALARMTREHAEHEADLARLVEVCAALEDDPRRLGALRDELAPLAARLAAALADADRAGLRDRMRARRARLVSVGTP